MSETKKTNAVQSTQPSISEYEFIEHHAATRSSELIAIVTLALVLVLFRFRALVFFNEAFLGGAERDAGLYIWLLRQNQEFFQNLWFDTPAFYPYGQTLAWSDNFLLPSLLASPFIAIGLSLPFVFNSLILLSSFLNGYFTYRLTFSLTGHLHGSLLAGIAFMTCGYLTGHLGHPQIQFAFFIPLGLHLYLRFLSKPSLKRSVPIGFVIFLAFLTTASYAIFLSFAIFVSHVAVIVLRPDQYHRSMLLRLVPGILAGMLPLFPFAKPYLTVRETFGGRGVFEAYAFSADIVSYFSSSPLSFLYGATAGWSHSEAHLFPGIIVAYMAIVAFRRLFEAKGLRTTGIAFIALLITGSLASLTVRDQSPLHFAFTHYLSPAIVWGILIAFGVHVYRLGFLERKLGLYVMTNRGLVAIFATLGLAFFTLSLGPLGNPEMGHAALGVFRLFYELFPGGDSIRAIARAGVLVIFSLSILSALALSHLSDQRGWSPVKNNQIFIALLLIVLLENFAWHYPVETKRPASKIFQFLKELPNREDALITLPFAGKVDANGQIESWSEFSKLNVNYMHWALESGRPSVNGYSGQRSWVMRNYPRKFSGFPDERSLNTIGMVAGLRYIVVVPEFIKDFNSEQFLENVSSYPDKLNLLMQDPRGNFLIEYTGTMRISENYYVLCPPRRKHQAFLVVELMSPHRESEIKMLVTISEDGIDHEFSALPLTTNGEWQQFKIDLPVPSSRVRPQKLSLSVHPVSEGEEDSMDTAEAPEVLIRKTRYQLYR